MIPESRNFFETFWGRRSFMENVIEKLCSAFYSRLLCKWKFHHTYFKKIGAKTDTYDFLTYFLSK